MTQRISPFIEAKFGWDFGESGWNTGADENWLKFSFLFDANVDSVVASLPPVSNGVAHFLTTDNRFYFGVGSLWYSTPCPKNFIFKVKSTNDFYQFNGVSATIIDNPSQLDSRLESVELSVSQLGSAAFKDSSEFATQSDIDITSAQSAAYTDNLETRLESGASPVGFIQGGVDAKLRTVIDKARERVSAEDFLGTDSDSIRSAVSSLSTNGGLVYLGKRGYVVADDTTGTAIPLTTPVSIKGTGGVYSSLSDTGVAAVTSTLRYNPSTSYDHTLTSLEGVHLGNPATGNRSGGTGLLLTTENTGQNLSKYTVRDVIVGQGNGPGIAHINDPVDNINGGMFCARFENSQIKGGIQLQASGDSNTISHCILSGNGIGVDASLVSGASLLAIENCNITTSGGAVRIDAGSRFRILGNNIEHYAAGASDLAVVNIAGASGTMNGGVIKENLISAFGSTDATRLLRLSNCVGTLVESNVFLRGSGNVTNAIVIDANCNGVRIGANVFSSGWTTPIIDNGVGTMGLEKVTTLQNLWVDFNTTETLKFIKTLDGVVNLYGSVKDGTTTNGTVICTLPVGFRPSNVVRAAAYTYDISGTTHVAEIIVDTAGNVLVNWAKAAQLSINLSFPAVLLANAESDI